MMDIAPPSLEKKSVLIIDDNEGVVFSIKCMLKNLGPHIDYALTLKEGLKKVHSNSFDLVFLDVNLPDGNGIEAIKEIVSDEQSPMVIILTAYSDPHGAELAIGYGAWNYIQKPIMAKDIRLQTIRAIQYLEQKKRSLGSFVFEASDIIGRSDALKKCRIQAAQIASSNSNVLITGETGTGKELFARAIHENSARRHSDFVVVDCSVLSEHLIESVLFGHEKGAYTGADKKRNGLIALADKGSLFLDEVGELPLPIQASFLRVLQERRFRPIGSEKEFSSDFRLICATNRDLDLMVSEGRFRNDLLFRLRALNLHLPPLREHKEDIPEITHAYLNGLQESTGAQAKQATPDFIEALLSYNWPGNVRELVHTIDASAASAQGESFLFAYHLPSKIRIEITCRSITPHKSGPSQISGPLRLNPDAPITYEALLDKTEKEYLIQIHSIYNGDINKIVETTGISRSALYRKLKRHNIK